MNETTAETREKVAKALQPTTTCNRNQSATIPEIVTIPDPITRIKCIFPLNVLISPPASSGKKNATSMPNTELIKNKRGPKMDPLPSLIPSCNPR